MSEVQAGEIATGEALMSVSGVAVRFESRRQTSRALDGVSLDWHPGEILGVVGESGCGKSTLARAMLGLQRVSEGDLHISGGVVSGKHDRRALRRRVQMIFQDPYQSLNPRQRVSSIVTEPLKVQGIPKEEHDERVRRALGDVGLDPERYLDRYPHQLSGGQRQRVAISAGPWHGPLGVLGYVAV
jgi:ABC-type dipeptide/oligopeptide/nickel transport system ATPase subunit